MNINFEIDKWNDISLNYKYKIETINNVKYLCYDEKNNDLKNLSFTMDTDEIMKKAMIDLLNIGKVLYYNEDDDIDEMIVSFANTYGLLGFMNTFPINNLYVSDDKVILKENNFEIEKPISVDEYFSRFFPKLDKKTINRRIKEYRENYLYNEISSHLRYSEFDKITILSKDYCEPIDLIKNYSKKLYAMLVNSLSNTRVEESLKFSNVSFEYIVDSTSTKMNYVVNSLINYIDILFISYITQENSLLKTCKFCNKAFIANSQKQEYDDIKCKNRASIQSYRKRQKEEN